MKNVMKKFGNMDDEYFGSKKTIPFLERAKGVTGCVVINRECSKPMAECLQRKSCDIPTTNLVRGDPHKIKSSHENLIGKIRQEILKPSNENRF